MSILTTTKAIIREDAIAALAKDAEALHAILADFPAAVIVWKATAMSAVRRSTTSASATGEPRPHVDTSRRSRCLQTA